MSNKQDFHVELESKLISKFNIALTLSNRSPNDVIADLISQYIAEIFKKEAEELMNKSAAHIQDIKPSYHIYKENKSELGLTNQIRAYITEVLNQAKEDGLESVDLRSGDIHKELELMNRMPSVCMAMESVDGFKNYSIIQDTPSGKSSTRVIRYFLK